MNVNNGQFAWLTTCIYIAVLIVEVSRITRVTTKQWTDLTDLVSNKLDDSKGTDCEVPWIQQYVYQIPAVIVPALLCPAPKRLHMLILYHLSYGLVRRSRSTCRVQELSRIDRRPNTSRYI